MLNNFSAQAFTENVFQGKINKNPQPYIYCTIADFYFNCYLLPKLPPPPVLPPLLCPPPKLREGLDDGADWRTLGAPKERVDGALYERVDGALELLPNPRLPKE